MIAVIGVGYGDEGKGATVNYLSRPSSTVIRFNGGAQAGHTVVHNGLRHVFSHFGSGTLKGAKTHLSRFFVCNPLGFINEYKCLIKNKIEPQISVDQNSYVTTPYDIYVNREIEKKRGNNRHGSVGIGFGETIERSERGFPLFVRDLLDEKLLWEKLKDISHYYFNRFIHLDLGAHFNDRWFPLHEFVEECQLFLNHINIIDDEEIIKKEKDIIFEGAQGLMLDPEYGTMPYCTRSNCGLKNIIQLIGNTPLDIYYVTRPYTTRHGVGPLPYECSKPYDNIIDHTNEPNLYQGPLRYAPLNIGDISRVVQSDVSKLPNDLSHIYGVMTCMDQLPDSVCYTDFPYKYTIKKIDIPYLYSKIINGRVIQLADTKHSIVGNK